ncbi:MAG: phosphodiester glycosidase family protein [Defluviitaleaceae bacterium]|nr:phosphodiester glycosidase family protein [Defluviitaleaceae bacterium]MCL2276097.1 phosphodiester glycosidase family protein [Defluviitaleaceae bacterium]
MKKFISICTVLFLSILLASTVNAAEVFFEYSTSRAPTRGVTYERLLQMTEVGMRDVHILRIPLNDPYIHIAPVASDNVGLRETTSALLSGAYAVAGINADFFNVVPGNHAVHLGPMIYNGQLLAANLEANRYGNGLAGFFIDADNNPFFQYMNIDVHLYLNGGRNRRINFINNIGNTLDELMVFTYAAMRDTGVLDARFPDTIKIVSDGRVITQITQDGQTVFIPEDGFVLVMPSTNEYRILSFQFSLGQSAQLAVENNLNLDLSRISSGIGGGGMLLINGEIAEDDGLVIAGRHPRSAVGVCRTGQNVILMVVDGRGISVGATHTEMAILMRDAGAFNAMHFDGGGSSTLVTQELDGRYHVLNAPSDGSQRRVANALGVFDNATPGEMTGIILEMAQTRAAVGTPVAATVLARDALGFRLPMPQDANVAYMVLDRSMGFWQDGYYHPLQAGMHTVQVWYNHLWASQVLYVVEIAELHAAPVSLLEGQDTRLRFTGTAMDGTTLRDVNVLHFTVVPESLGRVDDGIFYAAAHGGGTGYIRAWVGNVVAYVPVSIGGASLPINMSDRAMQFSGYPAFVSGSVRVDNIGTHRIPRLAYNIFIADETQAAHMAFYPPLQIPVTADATPVALRMQVYGDGSGHWLRARVRDGNGALHNIDFTRNADFYGWETVTAQLPANAPAPFELDRIWMVTLGASEASSHAVFFYNLQALYAPPAMPDVPQGARFRDMTQTHGAFTGIPGGGSFEFDIPATAGTYRFERADNMAIIHLSASSTGLTERRQWEYLQRDIRNARAENVVILMNANPLAFPTATQDLFHNMLRMLEGEGHRIFVVSSSSAISETVLSVRDGIRYIVAPQPETGAAQIRFWTDANDIWWYA